VIAEQLRACEYSEIVVDFAGALEKATNINELGISGGGGCREVKGRRGRFYRGK
jgi:hypothetical protein